MIKVGKTILHYQVLEKLGEGGMGIVYKALDTRLGRHVAIKILQPDGTESPERRLRFVQEARTASALNHPNIVTVYDIAAFDSGHLIAMEYVAGKTLHSLIDGRPLDVSNILSWGIQIADALARAHQAGIVHRDLKPANIMVVDGQVKILDFGLAKLSPRVTFPGDVETVTHTAAPPITHEGVVLGTAPYMSPEQVEGKPVDARSDIFSFGAMLYEMVTGRRAFSGDSSASVMSAVLREEPAPISGIAPRIPRELDKVIARCIRKDPNRRFQHILDAKFALEDLKQDFDNGTLAAQSALKPAGRGTWIVVGTAVLIALIGVGGFGWWGSRRALSEKSTPPLIRLTSDAGIADYPVLSPDGKLLAYASDRAGKNNMDLWVKQVPNGEPVRLTSNEADEYDASFSPDGTRIAYRSEQDGGGIYVIPALGGEPRLLVHRGRNPRWAPDGSGIMYRVAISSDWAWGDLFVVSPTGGASRQILPQFPVVFTPIWAPDSKHILFLGAEKRDAPEHDFDWWVAPLDGGAPKRTGGVTIFNTQKIDLTLPGVWHANRVFFAARTSGNWDIWEVSIDAAGRITSPARKLTAGTTDETSPSVSSDGQLAFSSAVWNTDIWSVPLDANTGKTRGDVERLTNDYATDMLPSVSGDGSKIAFLSDRGKPGRWNVWMKRLADGRETPLTFSDEVAFYGILSPDGAKVAYPAGTAPRWGIHQISADGGTPEKICEQCGQPRGWSPDGRSIIGQRFAGVSEGLVKQDGRGPSPSRLILVDVQRRTSRDLLTHPVASLYAAQFSPDGRWIAFGGRFKPGDERLFVASFHGSQVAQQETEWVRISRGAALDNKPRWSPDGTLIYFTSDRDNYSCVWAQRLDPVTKQPVGTAFAVLHLHGPQRSFAKSGAVTLEIAVAGDKLVFHLDEARGNIWMTKVSK